eukprot:2950659-Rhodomonas_salina.1
MALPLCQQTNNIKADLAYRHVPKSTPHPCGTKHYEQGGGAYFGTSRYSQDSQAGPAASPPDSQTPSPAILAPLVAM